MTQKCLSSIGKRGIFDARFDYRFFTGIYQKSAYKIVYSYFFHKNAFKKIDYFGKEALKKMAKCGTINEMVIL